MTDTVRGRKGTKPEEGLEPQGEEESRIKEQVAPKAKIFTGDRGG